METHGLSCTATTSCEGWAQTYDGSIPMQQAAGITSLVRGADTDDPSQICAVLQAEPGVLGAFMAENADLVAISGHVLGSTVNQVFLGSP